MIGSEKLGQSLHGNRTDDRWESDCRDGGLKL
ncbi:Uncharacterised protein [Vibrio cholerae]|nr:Uncharacterised protein [Vibrio cholerae]